MMQTYTPIKNALSYDAATGNFRWKSARRKANAGDVAGHFHTNGYRQISVCGRLFYSHRLAWLFAYGEWPAHEIDHINGVRSDNRIANLRLASRSQNMGNAGMRSDNKSGRKGVYRSSHSEMWKATIKHNGKARHLGTFESLEDAASAYAAAAAEIFGQFANVANT